jgi:hypothetical protein
MDDGFNRAVSVRTVLNGNLPFTFRNLGTILLPGMLARGPAKAQAHKPNGSCWRS